MAADAGFAPAKINLTLHVTGRRADGYHLLDSLVVFAGVGDRVTAVVAENLQLTVTGPRAGDLSGEVDNLVLRAARMLGQGRGAAIALDKHLPVASGIGGGSSDAAAALRVLAKLWDVPLPDTTAALGADVPVCMVPRARRMSGIGEVLADVPPLPPVWMVLVNPGVGVATADVFGALRVRDSAPMPDPLPRWGDAMALAAFLRDMRNDLEWPALQVQPGIRSVLEALRATDRCLVARMSGSGATCFGLYAAEAAANAARDAVGARNPGWWVVAAQVLQHRSLTICDDDR
jgi:4-diphosphocytidyl-2-C-methyl-D-erythritol kinase